MANYTSCYFCSWRGFHLAKSKIAKIDIFNLRLYFPDGAPPETTEISKTFIEVIEFLQYNEISGEYEKVYDTGEHIELNFEINGPGSTYSKTDKILDPSNEILEKAAYPAPDDPITTPIPLRIFLLPMEIVEVSFAGAKYHELKKDDVSVTYSAPHWVDKDGNGNPTDTANGEKDYSVAYTRDTKPSIGAKFSVQGLPNNLAIKLRAKGSDGIEIPETAAQVNGNDVTLPVTASSTNWPNTIKFYDRSDANKAFKLDWEIKVGDSDWAKVASTKHQVYLTLNDAIASPAGSNQETLFYLGSKNADGKSDANTAVGSIYADFKDQDVRRIGSDIPMTYYNNTNDPYATCNGLTDLLKTNDGRCGSFQELMNEILYAQGINNAQKVVFSPTRYINAAAQDYVATFGQPNQPLQGARDVFFVKNWNVDLNNRFAPQDLNGLAGQGNPNPLSIFGDHALIEYGGKIYDPSYGSGPFNNLTNWEDASVDAHGAQFIISASPLNQVLWVGSKDQKGVKELNSN